jgi:Tub family
MQSNFIGTEFQIFDDAERDQKRAVGPSILRQASFLAGPRHSLSPRATDTSAGTAELTEATSPLYASAQRSSARDGLHREGSADAGAPRSIGAAASAAAADTPADSEAPKQSRAELGVVQYHMNVMGTKGPRKMVIGIPYVDLDTNRAVKWRSGESMMPRCAACAGCACRAVAAARAFGCGRSGSCADAQACLPSCKGPLAALVCLPSCEACCLCGASCSCAHARTLPCPCAAQRCLHVRGGGRG